MAMDELRPLTQAGLRRTRDGAVGLRRLGVQPQRTLCSPLVRARQTVEIVHEGLKLEHPIESVDSLAGWRLCSIIADASMADVASVLIVGHEPTLGELIGLLIGGREASIRLRPGSVAKLKTLELHPGPCAELEWLLTPKQLAAIGR
jgi:phosphohistidine phosphatase